MVTAHGVARVSPDLTIKQVVTHRAWRLSKNLDPLLSTPQPMAWSSPSFSSPLCFHSSLLSGINKSNKNNLLNADHRHCAKCLHADCILTATLKLGRITFTDEETGSQRLENWQRPHGQLHVEDLKFTPSSTLGQALQTYTCQLENHQQ